MPRRFIAIAAALAASCFLASAACAAPELRWGGDSEGGFPYMFPDPNDPDKLIGFEVDIVNEICAYLGREPVYVNNAWDNLIPGLSRELYDIAINGLEVTEEHEESEDAVFSVPYYKTYLQLAVRAETSDIGGLEDLRGKIAGTLKESYAQMVLEEVGDIEIRTYIVEANTYEDLQNGRLDAALFDAPIALYSAGFNPRIKFVGKPIGEITYAIAVRRGDDETLRDINDALIHLRDSGKLREIYERWNLWSDLMANEFGDWSESDIGHERYDEWAESHVQRVGWRAKLDRYAGFMPAFGRAAVVTFAVSAAAMIIAVSFGLLLAITRVFAPRVFSWTAAAFIELMRGTPVLIQLFFIFYGLPSLGIKLPPFWAGAIGLGLNYAAYEAEIYRAGLAAIPRVQWEAALALGMTRGQAMREVILPQAARVILPPITNDFISLLKDSSLVSMITLVDLTKAYSQLAGAYYDYFGPGIIVAVIYLLLGLPFVRFSRVAERRLGGGEGTEHYRWGFRWR